VVAARYEGTRAAGGDPKPGGQQGRDFACSNHHSAGGWPPGPESAPGRPGPVRERGRGPARHGGGHRAAAGHRPVFGPPQPAGARRHRRGGRGEPGRRAAAGAAPGAAGPGRGRDVLHPPGPPGGSRSEGRFPLSGCRPDWAARRPPRPGGQAARAGEPLLAGRATLGAASANPGLFAGATPPR
jgi:hypothetical protein